MLFLTVATASTLLSIAKIAAAAAPVCIAIHNYTQQKNNWYKLNWIKVIKEVLIMWAIIGSVLLAGGEIIRIIVDATIKK